ncbi:MAG: NDP-sugar synthase [Elusimicrobia bacterium]|nr:NDP-sugar synthase [Elusimicrobiota bacterium]
MIALILIGGLGTRLRPFTCRTPKPLLPLLNKPFLQYQFDLLKAHGIRETVLCTSYRAEDFRKLDPKMTGVRLRFIHEKSPLGTGGAVKNAEGLLRGGEPVLIMNGDILHALDIRGFLKSHQNRRAEVSIALTRVKDPTLYGLVQTDESGRITRFLEKPSWDEIESNTINAGAYIFEPQVLELMPAGIPYSLERALFPKLLEDGRHVFGFVSQGYWMDIGTLESYLQVHLDILGGKTPFAPRAASRKTGLLLEKGVKLGRELTLGSNGDRVLVGRGTVIGDFARFSGNVCIGSQCRIGKGALLSECVVLEGTIIGDGARLERCLVGPGCRIGAQAVITQKTALAGGSSVEPFSHL